MRARHLLTAFVVAAAGAICSGCQDKKADTKSADRESADRLHAQAEALHASLGNPNSASYDETLYIGALQALLREPALAKSDSLRAAYRLNMVMKNRPGSVAKDFLMEFPDGRKARLSQIEADLLVLVFYDPECTHCTEVIGELALRLTGMDARILAVYTEGKEEIWRGAISTMPQGWEVAIDRDSIVAREVYSIPAMPTVYLLDSQRRVVLKDPAPAELEAALKN